MVAGRASADDLVILALNLDGSVGSVERPIASIGGRSKDRLLFLYRHDIFQKAHYLI